MLKYRKLPTFTVSKYLQVGVTESQKTFYRIKIRVKRRGAQNNFTRKSNKNLINH